MASRSASASRSHDPATYFRRTRPFLAMVIVGGMLYYGVRRGERERERKKERERERMCAVLAPSRIPYDGLGPLGRFTRYLQENHKPVFHVGYAVIWLLHIGEACLSIWLCNKKGITESKTQLRWFVQTLLCGLFSLYFLLVYKPPKKTQ
ncbi:transmembrane protein 254 isoform X1 [Pantherophis guttatus]|uniref:Transmembrane protein 254 n=1 Tax=Pantherophis guttatus TaxID=94885 RepID=A0ABM3ZMS9_PANGU|nr:transmembrane protein 254 isoform X1 [Pantherophis guttatus]